MNNKVNYTFVGFLVIVGFSLIFSFSYWMMKPKDNDEMKNYHILFDESILGLNVDSAVKYRGIDVGKVVKIRINPKNIEQVEVLISILDTTPIKENTIAKLTSQGITGLSYINLNLGDNNAPDLKAKAGEQYPVIKTSPSLMENIENSLGTVSNKFSKVLSKTEQLLNNENQQQISLILNRTASFLNKVEKTFDDKSLAHIHNILKNTDNVTNKVNTLLPKIDNLVDNSIVFEKELGEDIDSIAKSYLAVRGTMKEIEIAINNDEFNFKEMTKDTIPTLNNTLLQMESLMLKVEEVLQSYERSPSDILFKAEEIKKGPGE